MVRNAMFHKVRLAARDRFSELAVLDAAAAILSDRPGRDAMDAEAWEAALGAYWDEHETIGIGPEARAPELLQIDRAPAGASGRVWSVRQVIDDPDGDHDWAIVATVDLDASDAAGEPVINTRSFSAPE